MPKKGLLLHLSHVNRDNEIRPFELKIIDALNESDYSIWQHLPINPPGKYNSPYSALSSFAGDLTLISKKIEIKKDKEDFETWVKDNDFWIFDWALFIILKKKFNDNEWFNWPNKYKFRDEKALEILKSKNNEYFDRLILDQFTFDMKWQIIKEKANSNGIKLFGDLPFYVAMDSADVWANPALFDLNEKLEPSKIAGVPPDYFSAKGQIWENPIYNWKKHQLNNFKWWRERIKVNEKRFDLLRIDHFRAIVSGWCIEYGSADAVNGYWKRGPGKALLEEILAIMPSQRIIAEDLGHITSSVKKMIKHYKLKGMRVLQFGYGNETRNEHHHTNIDHNTVCYVGTHDNNTAKGWFKEMKLKEQTTNFQRLIKEFEIEESNCSKKMIDIGMNTDSKYFVATIQDVMNLDEEYRTNVPGRNEGNWILSFSQEKIIESIKNKKGGFGTHL